MARSLPSELIRTVYSPTLSTSCLCCCSTASTSKVSLEGMLSPRTSDHGPPSRKYVADKNLHVMTMLTWGFNAVLAVYELKAHSLPRRRLCS